jgi:hypothetical protein
MPSPKAYAPNYGSFGEAVAVAPPARKRTLYNRFGNAFAGLKSKFGNAGRFLHKRLLGTRNEKEGSGRRKFLGRVFNKARSLTRRGMSAARGARSEFKRGSTIRSKFSRALAGARAGIRKVNVALKTQPIVRGFITRRRLAAANAAARAARGPARGSAAPAPAVVEAVEDFTARPSARAQANVLTAIASSPPRAAASALSAAANGPINMRLKYAPGRASVF